MIVPCCNKVWLTPMKMQLITKTKSFLTSYLSFLSQAQLQKIRTLEEERRNLEEARRLLELERQKELMKLKQMHDNYNEDMAKAQEKAYYNKLREIEEKLAYNEMMRNNEQKQLLKEANYRNVTLQILLFYFIVLQIDR